MSAVVDEMERLGRDRPRTERLQDALAEIDVAAAVAADVEDQAVRRQRAGMRTNSLTAAVDVAVCGGANVASRT